MYAPKGEGEGVNIDIHKRMCPAFHEKNYACMYRTLRKVTRCYSHLSIAPIDQLKMIWNAT